MRRLFILVILAPLALGGLLLAAPDASSLPDLFRKAKEEVKLGSYDAALATLGEIEKVSQQPGLEKDRAALQPSLAFYRGVCDAALGRDAEARQEFAAFLASNPNVKLDPALYPKKVIAAFEAAQGTPGRPQTEESKAGIAAAYRAFPASGAEDHADVPDNWADGPARFLLTPAETQEFRHLPDPISRSEFIAKFWRARDTKPETPENEFRQEFERRVAFADHYFVQGETRGSATDRGTVFILLGPPAYSMQRPLKTGDDTADPAALFLNTPATVQEASIGGKSTGSRSAQIARVDAASGPGTSMISASNSWREVWRYMRKDLPGKLPYEWVDFDFLTKPGYGQSVLQRDPTALDTIDRAKASLPRP